jgi:protein SCO1
MNRTKSIVIGIVLAIVAVIAGMLLSRALMERMNSSDAIALTSGTLLEPTRPLPSFSLVDQRGEPFGNAALRGGWTFMFFGFTHCPDVCPTTLRLLAQVQQSLGDLEPALRPQVTLVSVDPKRDTPEQLAKYVSFFGAEFRGVTGSVEDIESFTRQIGVPVAITPVGDSYTVDHSGAIFLIDPTGAIRALFSPPHTAATLAEDYRRIVKH